MLSAGAAAPDFTLRDTRGEQHSLRSILARGPALIALYKVSCPVCQLSAPYLERLATGALQVVTISQDDEAATRKFQETFGLTAPSLLDAKQDGYRVSNAFGIRHVPSLFVVETDGTISSSGSGFSKSQFEDLGERAGVDVFHPSDNVPEWRPG
jgi:peroxiredoxin